MHQSTEVEWSSVVLWGAQPISSYIEDTYSRRQVPTSPYLYFVDLIDDEGGRAYHGRQRKPHRGIGHCPRTGGGFRGSGGGPAASGAAGHGGQRQIHGSRGYAADAKFQK